VATRWRGPALPGNGSVLLLAFALLCAYSLAALWSVTEGIHGPYAILASGVPKTIFWRQAVWIVLAWGVLLAVRKAPLSWIEETTPLLYLGVLALLGLVLLAGPVVAGSRRWFFLGPVHFQPSEPAKLVVVLALARWLAAYRERQAVAVAGAAVIAGLPALLVLKEPDLGTSLVFAGIALVMVFWNGLPLRLLLAVGSPLVSAALSFYAQTVVHNPWPWAVYMILLIMVLWLGERGLLESLLLLAGNLATGIGVQFLWRGLHAYQQSRILSFFNPARDSYGAGYQTIQSRVAIGSGGLFGTGYLQGTQKGLAFLPERHTDFIFSVIGEELGFVGSTVLVVLFGVVLWKAIRVAEQARRPFSALAAVGVAGYLGCHVVVNLMITTGMLPVTGLPLPVISYGGSNLLVTAAALGLLINIGSRSFEV